jgi:hypothetical protein
MKIKNFKSFLEAISGMELPSTKDLVNYGQEDNSPMKKLGTTDVIHSDLFGIVVTYDQYQDYYNQYLKIVQIGEQTPEGGSESPDDGNMPSKILHGFNLENLDKVLSTLPDFQKRDEENN